LGREINSLAVRSPTRANIFGAHSIGGAKVVLDQMSVDVDGAKSRATSIKGYSKFKTYIFQSKESPNEKDKVNDARPSIEKNICG